jgi:hypothetical protein
MLALLEAHEEDSLRRKEILISVVDAAWRLKGFLQMSL